MRGLGFCSGAEGGWDEVLGWPLEDGGVGGAGQGVVGGGDVEGEGEEGKELRAEEG